MEVDMSEPYVIDILDNRDIDIAYIDKPGGRVEAYAPAWAILLARAERFDRFDPAGKKSFVWRGVWNEARKDIEFQKATSAIVGLDAKAAVDPRVFRKWVNNWLYRRNGVWCFPPDMVDGAVIRAVKPMAE